MSTFKMILIKVLIIECFIIHSSKCSPFSVSFVLLSFGNQGYAFFLLPPIFTIPPYKRKQPPTTVIQQQSCMGDCGLQGYCETKSNCLGHGGTASGLCTDSTVCCINILKCGSSTNMEIGFFVNPNYPNAYRGGSKCDTTVLKSNSNICQVRLDFVEFKLQQPSSDGKCVNDFFTVIECMTEKLCGDNKNQHVYVDFDEGKDKILLSIDTNAAQNAERLWTVKITQIPCNSTDRAPTGCLMYYTSTSGTVQSFNYGDLTPAESTRNRIISGLNYGICVRSNNEYCNIEWLKDGTDPYSFTISGDGSLSANMLEAYSLTGEQCGNNFIVIGNPYRNNVPVNVDRFCGTWFNRISANSKPFVLRVVTGQNISAMTTADRGLRGFRLQFRQLPCHS